jgi:hypothetical protein
MTDLQIQDIRRLSHATVVAASSREESLRCAGRLAAAVVCRASGPVPCGVCPACRKAMAGIHPDVIRVKRPEDDKGRPKKEIQVDQIRQMAADAVVLPNESERKVYLIEDADSMNVPAQNAALKLLEEPPAGVYFLLCVTNPAQLLPTVRSRCAEWSSAGGQEEQDPELRKLAEEFLRLTAARDRAGLFRWCAANENMDNRGAAAFVDCAADCAARRITGRAKSGGMRREELLRLSALLDRCAAMLRVNTGVKHVMGLLAVDAIAEDENRGVQH